MKKALLAGMLALSLCPRASAAPKHWFTDPRWWAGTAAIWGGVIADDVTTQHGLARGASEGNILFGPHPRTLTLNLVTLAKGIGFTAAHAEEWHVANKIGPGWRKASYFTVPGIVGGTELGVSIHNATVK